ncbi:unnamed protein product [Urochloa humidicola]
MGRAQWSDQYHRQLLYAKSIQQHRCCLRRSVVGDGPELGSGGTEVSRLGSGGTEILLVKDATRDVRARERCT